MFETFCTFLLRFYPAEFRRAYGHDAVQLMKDRAQHERTVLLRIRLIMDLLIDLCTISLDGWHPAKRLIMIAESTPRFDILETHCPSTKALAAGTLASLLVFVTLTVSFREKALPFVFSDIRAGGPALKGRPLAAIARVPQSVTKNADPRGDLVASIADNLKRFYVDRAVGRQLSDAVLTHENKGDYQSLAIGPSLAVRINQDIQNTARGLGIPRGVFVADVVYSERPLPTGAPSPMTDEMRERNRLALLGQHCLFETVETLPHNIGYLKLNGFAEGNTCKETTSRAMTSLNDSSALIIDLRDNGGGFGDTALQIAGYLFDRPTYMYDPRPDSPVPAKTASPIAGNKLVDKPVYVLTSSTTQSAAEYFVYNLKMLRRAVVVGETTAGHQHSGGFYRLNDHFGIGIQDAPPPNNPYGVKGWEIIGVEPDVKISSREALDAAKKRAASNH